jgi:threonine/homoserine/homoserine lactone efflux protein
MPLDSLLLLGPVTWYVFVMTATPGPNNAMLTSSGMNFGLKRTWPHIAGIAFGFPILLLLSGLGLGAVFIAWPEARIALAVLGSVYLVYLAWRIANAAAPTAKEGARPLRFAEAFGFQFLNPKGWVMALTAATMIPPMEGAATEALVLGAIAFTIGWPCLVVWTLFGVAIARLFQRPKLRRAINWTLAALLVATIPFLFR